MGENWAVLDGVMARELRVSLADLDRLFQGPPETLAKSLGKSKLLVLNRILNQYGVAERYPGHLPAPSGPQGSAAPNKLAENILALVSSRKASQQAARKKRPMNRSLQTTLFAHSANKKQRLPDQHAAAMGGLSAYQQLQSMPFVNELLSETQRIKALAQQRAQAEPRSNDEAKAEPPRLSEVPPATSAELPILTELQRLGFSEKRTLQVLREYNGDMMRAKSRLLEDLRDYQDMKQMDQSREASELTARDDEARAEKDRRGQLSYTDVLSAGIFKNSMLLDQNIGVAALREILCVERDGAVDLTHAELRDTCIRLLGLEAQCFSWFGVGACAYISQIIRRLRSKRPSQIDYDYLWKLAEDFNEIIIRMPHKQGHMPEPFVKALYEVSDLANLQAHCGPDCFLANKTLPSIDEDVVVADDFDTLDPASSSSSSSSTFSAGRKASSSSSSSSSTSHGAPSEVVTIDLT